MQIKVAIVDDDDGIRHSLAAIIRRTPNFKMVGEYANAETALKELPRNPPDVVLMDINLPGMKGVECVRQIKAILPEVQALMLTVMRGQAIRAVQFLESGGERGYLLKRTVVRAVGRSHPRRSRRRFADDAAVGAARGAVFHQTGRDGGGFCFTPDAGVSASFWTQLAKGYAYKEIADRMNISIDTVRSYVRTVYEKLHVHSPHRGCRQVFARLKKRTQQVRASWSGVGIPVRRRAIAAAGRGLSLDGVDGSFPSWRLWPFRFLRWASPRRRFVLPVTDMTRRSFRKSIITTPTTMSIMRASAAVFFRPN